MPIQKLTKLAVERLEQSTSNQIFYWDTDLKGFGLVIGLSSKSYVAQGNIDGKSVRVTIGKHGVFTCEEARAEARRLLNEMARGIDPRARRKEEQESEVTLREAFANFLSVRRLKPYTVYDYQGIMRRVFHDWMDIPLRDISRAMVREKHAALQKEIAERKGDVYYRRGQAHANGAMRVFRSVYNFALATYESAKFPENPVLGLSQTRSWFKDRRRKSVISIRQLPAWFRAVWNLNDPLNPEKAQTVRDYLLLILFTGLRRMEAAKLRWEQVDFEARTITIDDTKNGESHILPLPPFIMNILISRFKRMDCHYVFSWAGVKQGYLMEPGKYHLQVQKESGVDFILHDLRRTFITIAESLDIPAYALKLLLNHQMHADVTAGYIVADVERLRKPMEKIATYILSIVDMQSASEIIDLKPSKIRRPLLN